MKYTPLDRTLLNQESNLHKQLMRLGCTNCHQSFSDQLCPHCYICIKCPSKCVDCASLRRR